MWKWILTGFVLFIVFVVLCYFLEKLNYALWKKTIYGENFQKLRKWRIFEKD